MNYEERYKKALERARKVYIPIENNILDDIFPELKESEDERIRKGIIRNLEYLAERAEGFVKDELKERIARLEKQGEKKSADEVLKIRQELYQSGYNDGYKHGQEDITMSLSIGENINHTDIKEKAHQIAWEKSKDYDPLLSKEAWCEMAALDMASWLKKQGENKSDFSDIRVWKYIVDMVLTEKDGIGNYLDNPDTERIAKKLQERYGNLEKQGEQHSPIDINKMVNEFAHTEFKGYGIPSVIDVDVYRKGIEDALEKQGKKLDADKVIEWLNHHELSRDDVVTSVIPDDSPTSVPHRVKWLSDEFIKQFKKDFGL